MPVDFANHASFLLFRPRNLCKRVVQGVRIAVAVGLCGVGLLEVRRLRHFLVAVGSFELRIVALKRIVHFVVFCTRLDKVDCSKCCFVVLLDISPTPFSPSPPSTPTHSPPTVTAIHVASDMAAVGYSDGSIRLFSTTTHSLLVVLNGHRAAISALQFDSPSRPSRLASGAKDTDIILWDLISESGLFRLKGHKNGISGLAFHSSSFLISTSHDSLLKLWDLTTQHCCETMVAHRGHVTCMAYNQAERLLYTAGGEGDRELKVWRLEVAEGGQGEQETMGEEGEQETKGWPLVALVASASGAQGTRKSPFVPLGAIARRSNNRANEIRLDLLGGFLGLQSNDRTVEVWKVLDTEEMKKREARRRKRLKEKEKEKKEKEGLGGKKGGGTDVDVEVDVDVDVDSESFTWSAATHLRQFHLLTTPSKTRSFDFATTPKHGTLLSVSLSTNSLEIYKINNPSTPEPISLAYSITLPGHRSDPRCIALSNDSALLLSGASDGAKIWNLASTHPIRTLSLSSASTSTSASTSASEYVICCTFIPGDKHVLLGLKSGILELWDLPSSTLLQSFEAHGGACWGLQVRPDKRGVVSGGADGEVKFWDFGMLEEGGVRREPTSQPANEQKGKERLTGLLLFFSFLFSGNR